MLTGIVVILFLWESCMHITDLDIRDEPEATVTN